MIKHEKYLRYRLVVLLLLLLLPLAGCGDSSGPNGPGTSSSAEIRLQGAGATFPNPLYQKWFSEYNKIAPNAKFDYQSIGSGGGIKQITAKTVDFGGSDAPMKDDDLKAVQGEILHIPTVLGAVVVTYNIPSFSADLKLTPEAIAGISLGTITKWNDPAITASNPGVSMPDATINPVHRSDGSGTSFIWTEYLSKVSPEWKEKIGAGTMVNWPSVGMGAKGNEGVTGQVKQTPNSLGYVELIYAEQNKLPYASIKNASGEFVKPSLSSVTAAAASAANQMPDDLRVSITNAPGKDAYPISSYTYFLVYKEQPDQAKGKALVDFLWWSLHDGEQMANTLLYSPLPAEVVAKAEQKIKSITFQGKPLHSK
jgi:phosphate transport system substrate-binding protein